MPAFLAVGLLYSQPFQLFECICNAMNCMKNKWIHAFGLILACFFMVDISTKQDSGWSSFIMINTSYVTALFKAVLVAVSVFSATMASAVPLTIEDLSTPRDGTNWTWRRPVASLSQPSEPPSELSQSATDVAYDVVRFMVSAADTYGFESRSGDWDNYTFLYKGSFNPLDQLVNVIIGNNDISVVGYSGFNSGFSSLLLEPGVDYYLITTGFANTDGGGYLAMITPSDPENFVTELPYPESAVPEPGSLALLGLGLVGLATVRQRPRART